MYDSRAFWIIVSLIASLVFWIYVSSVETEEFKQTFRGVKLELVGEPNLRDSKNLVITDLDTNTVTIEVVGPRRVVAGLDNDDIVALIDVSKLSRSAYTSQQYNVVFPDGTDTNNLTVTRKIPETVNFLVSTQTSKVVQVRGSFDGTLAEGYTAETPVFEPSTITLMGSEAYLKNVEYAWVTFSKVDVASTYSVETGFTLMDANNEACSTTGISFSTDVVTATLPLLTLKDVKLDVNLIEGAGASSANTKVTIEPSSIALAGDSVFLDGMNKIVLATIDLTDFSNSFTETYSILPFPDGTIRDIHDDPNGIILDPDALVSMNMWGFTPSFFDAGIKYLSDFLKDTSGDPLKKECLLPALVDHLMHSKGLKVEVLSTDAVWFGVTYKEDKQSVVQAIKNLFESGYYDGING